MPKIAYIEWDDAHGSHSTITLGEALKLRIDLMKTAGIILEETEQEIRIAQDTWDVNDESYVRDVEVIPKKYIVKMKTWVVK